MNLNDVKCINFFCKCVSEFQNTKKKEVIKKLRIRNIFKRKNVKDNYKIEDIELEEIERKAKKEVDELFANTVKDVEFIEVCFRNGEVEKFEHDDLEWYSRDESTFEIKTKTRRVIMHLNEVRIITIKNFPSESMEKEIEICEASGCPNKAKYQCIEDQKKYCDNCKILMNVNGAGIEIDDYHFKKINEIIRTELREEIEQLKKSRNNLNNQFGNFDLDKLDKQIALKEDQLKEK